MATILAARSRSRSYQKGLIDSTSMSIACSSMLLSRSSSARYVAVLPRIVGGVSRCVSSPRSAVASSKKQCACTSIVLTRLPLTVTGRAAAGCAQGAVGQQQPAKTIPAAAPAAPRSIWRRELIALPSPARPVAVSLESSCIEGDLQADCDEQRAQDAIDRPPQSLIGAV